MKAITYSVARKNLASTMDRVCEDGAPVRITRTGKGQAVVVMSLDEYQQLEETAHLLRSPANAKRLIWAIDHLSRGHVAARKTNR